MRLKIYTDKQPWKDSLQIYIVGEDANGRRLVVQPTQLVFKIMDECERVEPTFEISGPMSRDFLPAFRDAIIEAGYNDTADTKALEFIKNHLKDMQKLVFKEIK